MNFSSMDYFVMAAQEKNFTHAAERLHITQQTLSTHIANLEKELGSRLFVRSTPLELTYAGQVFLAYAADFRRKRQTLGYCRAYRPRPAGPGGDDSPHSSGILQYGDPFEPVRAGGRGLFLSGKSDEDGPAARRN